MNAQFIETCTYLCVFEHHTEFEANNKNNVQLHFNVQLFIDGKIVHVYCISTAKILGKFIETKLNATRYNNKYLFYLH